VAVILNEGGTSAREARAFEVVVLNAFRKQLSAGEFRHQIKDLLESSQNGGYVLDIAPIVF